MKDLKLSLRTNLLIVMVALGLGSNSPARAAVETLPVNVTFNIVAAACEIDGGTVIPIDLNSMYSTEMQLANTYGGNPKAFSLKVKNCPEETEFVEVKFTNANAATGSDFYPTSGTALNVDIELKAADGTILGPDSVYERPVDISTHSASIDLVARAHTSVGNVTPGNFESVVVATFSFK